VAALVAFLALPGPVAERTWYRCR